MSNERNFDQQEIYEIKVKGHLDPKWSAWFDGFTIDRSAGDVCLLTGPVMDQAALHGLLANIRDLGLPLLSVARVEDEDETSNRPVG